MSTLVLVRHAQATPFEADTDRLSALGARQAAALAEWWLTTGTDVDEVYAGTLERQARTAEVVADRMLAAGRAWPPTTTDTGFDEYDGDGIFGVLARQLADRDADFRVLARAAQQARGTAQQNRHFQRMVEHVADRWRRGELTDPAVEGWPAFCDRIDGAVDRILDGGRGRTVAVFTSGGVIGRTLQRVLRAPDETALALNWRIRNASLTQLTFSGRRVSLDAFNVTAHLQVAGLDTFR
ncbi:MAG TPA: histidine phosphatase family protein [Euzebyales bacterium]|nr:histidine phosphatase family protein [Euzebyales bacterium]